MALSTNMEFFLDSFGQNFPEENHGNLDCISIAISCAFNRQGTLLAVGCNDGRICIWDFTTRSVAKIITGHVHPVCSLSWSRNGQRLASASTDGKVCIWETLTGETVWQYNFSVPITRVQCHPRNMHQYVILPFKQLAVVVTINRSVYSFPRLPTEDGPEDHHSYVTYSRRGDFIFTGNQKGRIAVVDSKTLRIQSSFQIVTMAQSGIAIRTIEISRRGENMVVNSADRIIRIYKISDIMQSRGHTELEPSQRLQDLVNKNAWKKVFFSGDGEYVCAGSLRTHQLYIWENFTGNLVKILVGTKGETLMDAAWHPIRPIVVSISGGIVSIWSQTHVENWSAFTPDFRELDENVEYEERESEFDMEDEDKSVTLEVDEQDENDDVDVVTLEKNAAYCSSDEEEDDPEAVLFIPVIPEIEEPEVDNWLTDNGHDIAMPTATASGKGGRENDKRPKNRKDSTQTGGSKRRLDAESAGGKRGPRTH